MPPTIDVISDIHLPHIRADHGAEFVAGWVAQSPILVLAGDVGEFHWWLRNLQHVKTLSEKYEQILFVAGNHEYYGTHFEEGDARFRAVEAQIENFRFLEKEVIEVNGIVFAGCSLWFRDNPMNQIYENWMNDFHLIKRFRHEVYKRNAESRLFLEHLRGVDVVITHHLPSHRSIHRRFERDPLNSFFLCEMEHVIFDLHPKIWAHGHTHMPCDYILGDTRVVCNPKGYPRERYTDNEDYGPLTVEI